MNTLTRYAQVANGVVLNVIESETDPDGVNGSWIACGDAGPGWLYAEGDFFSPEPDEDAPAARRITVLAFRNRFALSEKIAMEIASLDDASLPMPQRQQAAALRVYQADALSATFIDLDRADTRAAVQALEAAGVIGVGRAATILDTEVAPLEVYRG